MKNIKPTIQPGQRYYDPPIYTEPQIDLIKISVDAAFNKRTALPKPILTGYEPRVRLRWMKPDGKGGLVPKRRRRVR